MRKKLLASVLSAIMITSMIPTAAFASASVTSEDVDMAGKTNYTYETEVTCTVESSLTVTIPKKIVLDTEADAVSFDVKVEGDIAGEDTVTVEFDGATKIASPGKPDVALNASGLADGETTVKYVFDYEDAAAAKVENTTFNYDHKQITAGVWAGIINFSIDYAQN